MPKEMAAATTMTKVSAIAFSARGKHRLPLCEVHRCQCDPKRSIFRHADAAPRPDEREAGFRPGLPSLPGTLFLRQNALERLRRSSRQQGSRLEDREDHLFGGLWS